MKKLLMICTKYGDELLGDQPQNTSKNATRSKSTDIITQPLSRYRERPYPISNKICMLKYLFTCCLNEYDRHHYELDMRN